MRLQLLLFYEKIISLPISSRNFYFNDSYNKFLAPKSYKTPKQLNPFFFVRHFPGLIARDKNLVMPRRIIIESINRSIVSKYSWNECPDEKMDDAGDGGRGEKKSYKYSEREKQNDFRFLKNQKSKGGRRMRQTPITGLFPEYITTEFD